MENSSKPSIPDFFKGKSVFITGGLGSLGKVTVEKLLRSCPGIENIFLLARPKKNNNVQDRLNELKNSPLFANLKENSPELLKKIVMIEGDTAKDNLGISEADQKMICEKVSIFINSAASINFNDPLKDAVNTNVRSIMELLKLARKVKNLESIVHVSTSYTNWFCSDNDTVLVEEKFYPAEYKPNDILKLTETVSEKLLEKVTPHILGKHKNTYTFTKKLAEEFIKNEKENLPITIVRPSMSHRNNSTIPVKNQQVDSNLKYASNVSMDFGSDSVKEDNKSSKIKPIIVDSGLAAIRNFIQNLKLKKKPMLRISGKKTQIFCEIIESKKIILDKLKIRQYTFHTFMEESEKSKIFLLKGLYLEKVENVKNHLVNAGLKCYNCQQRGHSSNNRGYKSRCVKCRESHASGECKRKLREGDPSCINCGGKHAANFRGCSEFMKYQQKIQSFRQKAKANNRNSWNSTFQNESRSTQFNLYSENFPSLSENFRPSINNQTFDQHVISPTISSTQDVKKANSLIQKFNEAFIGSAKEPMPGWIDSWVGPTTYAYFIARGIFRSFYVHKNNVTEVIPVDMTANLIIASAWKVGTEKIQKEPEIYHSTIGIANFITWKNLMDLYLANAKKYPLDDVIWYPTYRMIKTEFGSKFYGFFTERIPAYLIDFASIIMGKKPRMIRLYDKIEYGYSFTRFCTINPIRFECKNFEKLIDKMSPNDVKEFDFDVRKINWNKFIEEQHLGARKYLWGSKSTDFAAGRRKIARLRIANYLLVGSTVGSSLFLSYKGFNLLTHKEPKIEINLDQTN
ncbi:hypothetical protein PVAND_001518 [Polypedilum vanderplanki]|uniref:Fatty acyl-CoA reductase n=1 Tax=Polypedilum vanderplanki TaxID=319348 RepID=A0A9J6BN66_POLVA|nr:hypothetical protein PVAND_001518 [Polypedilum vanderplanki]